MEEFKDAIKDLEEQKAAMQKYQEEMQSKMKMKQKWRRR